MSLFSFVKLLITKHLVHQLINHHLKGVKWVVTFSRERHGRGIANVPVSLSLLSGDLLIACTQAISISMLVGLAVDYVLHIAECYNRAHILDVSSNECPRLQRVRIALGEMGRSVVCGAFTTVGVCKNPCIDCKFHHNNKREESVCMCMCTRVSALELHWRNGPVGCVRCAGFFFWHV